MSYYIWKRDEKIVSHINSINILPPPAIKISDDEAKSLGIYSPPPVESEPEPAQTDTDLMAEAYREGVNEA